MKKILFAIISVFTLNGFSQSISSGVTGMWNFNGSAVDGSGFNNNGTVNGASLTSDRFGSSNKSYLFSGNQSIGIPNLLLSNNFSISVFATLSSISQDYSIILGKWAGASGQLSYELSKRPNNKIGFYFSTNGSNYFGLESTTVFSASANWFHIAITYDGQSVKFYVNGVLQNTLAHSTPVFNNNDVTYVGATRTATPGSLLSWFWNGKIDDVATWNRAITAQEVASLANGTVALPVELTQFSASCSENTTTINWQTASENNSAYFEVLQSRDGETWTSKTTTPAAGNSTSTIDYSFTDNNEASLVYYKLNQVDKDGKSQEYGPISANCNESTSLSIFPNPTNGEFNLVGMEHFGTITSLEVKDATGKVVKAMQPTTTQFKCNELKAGVYFLAVSAGKTMKVIKIIKE
jgi:hypothetical protein